MHTSMGTYEAAIAPVKEELFNELLGPGSAGAAAAGGGGAGLKLLEVGIGTGEPPRTHECARGGHCPC